MPQGGSASPSSTFRVTLFLGVPGEEVTVTSVMAVASRIFCRPVECSSSTAKNTQFIKFGGTTSTWLTLAEAAAPVALGVAGLRIVAVAAVPVAHLRAVA